MATIVERIGMIARANVSELRERYEDPEKVVNQAIADAMVTYTDLKREAASVFEGEDQARQRVESLTSEADRWHNVARKALAAGNEADARLALSRRQDLLDRLKGPQELYEQAQQVAASFRKRLAELEDAINRLQAKLALVKAKEASVRAAEATDSVTSSTGTSSAAQTLREREQQADWDLAEAEGLAQAREVAATDPFEALADAAAAHTTSSSVDDALAALRTQIEVDDDDDDEDDDD